jgi:DNA sulfur modification protein DndD
MEIKSIRLKNFRQFYGDQIIKLAGSGEKNVTLIHAENGVGKTTLLNAVLWTFFGATTKKFEQKERILNFEAEREGDRTATVEVVFEHEDADYLAQRNHTVTPGGQNKIRFSVMKVGKTGSLGEPLPNPDAFINTVIPNVMAPYFFFDGEQAETFGAEVNNKAIAAAIRDILGSTLIETAISDLKYVARKFNEEMGSSAGDAEIAVLTKKITELEEGKAERSRQIEILDKNIDSFGEQLKVIAEKLLEVREAAHLQRTREDKKHQLNTTKSQLTDAQIEILRWISTKTIASVSATLTTHTLDFIDEESLKGRIPSPYNEEFVKGLLEAKKCVCERPLNAGSDEWRAVTSLLSNAANAEVLSRVVRARARISILREQRDDAPQLLKLEEERVARLLTQQNTLEREIEEISQKLADMPEPEIQEREHARKEFERKLESAKTEKMRATIANESASEEILKINRQIADLAVKNVAAQQLMIRQDLAERGAEFLQAFLQTSEQSARKKIEDEVNRVLEKTARRHYKFEIDESFQIRLLFEDGTPTPKSGGENQMMSLAFITALVQYADARTKSDENGLFIPATVAPLILDSPFGQLDDSYRQATAKFVPEMAPQVVLLVSSSQGKAEVIDALQSRIGAEYVLIAHNAGPKGEKKQDFLTIGGKKMATTLFSRDRNMTEIQEVRS